MSEIKLYERVVSWNPGREVRTRSTEPGPPGRCRGHPGADCIKKRGSIFYGISIEFPGDATIYSVKFRWVAPRYTGGEELLATRYQA